MHIIKKGQLNCLRRQVASAADQSILWLLDLSAATHICSVYSFIATEPSRLRFSDLVLSLKLLPFHLFMHFGYKLLGLHLETFGDLEQCQK